VAATGSPTTPQLECEAVYISRGDGRDGGAGFALRGLTLSVAPGAFVPLLGPSGAGKTALLRVLAGLTRPLAGRVTVAGLSLTEASDSDLRELRRGVVGFVPRLLGPPARTGGLLPELDAANIALPLRLAGVGGTCARRRVLALRELLGLGDLPRVPAEQLPPAGLVRLAIASALAHQPALLLLDEPGAGLTEQERDDLLELLRRLHEELRLTVLLATRDGALAHRIGGVVRVRDGRAQTELVRQVAFSRGQGERTEELALLDGEGRVALPAAQREVLGIGRRARVTLEDDHIAVWPERPPPKTGPPWRRR